MTTGINLWYRSEDTVWAEWIEEVLDSVGVAKHLTDVSLPRLQKLREKFAALPEWNHDSVEGAIPSCAKPGECPTRRVFGFNTDEPVGSLRVCSSRRSS